MWWLFAVIEMDAFQTLWSACKCGFMHGIVGGYSMQERQVILRRMYNDAFIDSSLRRNDELKEQIIHPNAASTTNCASCNRLSRCASSLKLSA